MSHSSFQIHNQPASRESQSQPVPVVPVGDSKRFGQGARKTELTYLSPPREKNTLSLHPVTTTTPWGSVKKHWFFTLQCEKHDPKALRYTNRDMVMPKILASEIGINIRLVPTNRPSFRLGHNSCRVIALDDRTKQPKNPPCHHTTSISQQSYVKITFCDSVPMAIAPNHSHQSLQPDVI